MTKLKTLAVVAAGLLLVGLAPLSASEHNKKTELEVNEPIEIPGTVLPPGDYVMELVNTQQNNHIVRFMNKDESKTIATVLAVPNERVQPTGTTQLKFYETPLDAPPALRAWFFPGDESGQEFAYPEKRASELSAYSHRYVPSVPDSMSPDQIVSVHVEYMSPEHTKTSAKAAGDANWKADQRMSSSSAYATFGDQQQARKPQTALESRIRKELVTLPYYSVWDHFEFKVNNGNVTLMGEVHRPTLKVDAARAVSRIEGVKHVDNNIEVLPTSPQDDQIRQAVYRAVYGQPALERYQMRAVPPIHIIVDQGNVTLEGTVANKTDKTLAGVQAKTVNGVFSVENNLQIG